MSEPLPPDVRAAMDASNKIEAIRLLRVHTGLGLQEAKEAVEAGYLPSMPPAQTALPSQLPAEAITALQQGNKIDAIRIVRAELGIGLKEAKELVDAAEAGSPRGTDTPKNSLPPGVVQTTRTGMAVLVLAIALGTAAVWWIITRP
jgi:ribosomal protein L7/L12